MDSVRSNEAADILSNLIKDLDAVKSGDKKNSSVDQVINRHVSKNISGAQGSTIVTKHILKERFNERPSEGSHKKVTCAANSVLQPSATTEEDNDWELVEDVDDSNSREMETKPGFSIQSDK